MAIDDNTVYGLTGAQVKELPEKINAVKGLAKELTTDDYNYPTDNPTGVALWLLPSGVYSWGNGVSVWKAVNSSATGSWDTAIVTDERSSKKSFFIFGNASGTSNEPRVCTINTSNGTVQREQKLLLRDNVRDNLTSTSTDYPLSANQGRVLKNLIDGIAVPTATSDLTNDGSDGTSTYVEADELASVATSGSYNDLSDKPTIPTVPTNVSAFTNDAGYQTASQVNTAVGVETTARQSADNNLQQQIDAISASSDVKDIVGTKAELNNYDTTTLGDNDIIKVLQDESQNGETTYYRWSTTTSTFTLIGEEGPYYTKSEADALLNAKANISSLATVATSGSYNDLTNKPTIPTVNDATLTIQANGTTVNTFTANASSNVTANIPSATTSRYGVTQPPDSTSSTSTALAATSSAVKSAYDLAETKAKITMSSTDPGEGVALAENEYIAVYGGDAMNLDYSTTEKATGGTWIDGSAIYKKTVNFGALPNNADKTVAHGISNLGRVIKLEGMAYDSSTSTYAPLPYASDSASAIDVSVVGSNIRIHTFTDRTAFSDTYVTLYYTKSS